MPRTRVGWTVLLPALLALQIGLAGCSSNLVGSPPEPSPLPESTPTRVSVTFPEPVVEDDLFPSNLYVERDVEVTARRSGIIEEVLVQRGDRVRAGQPLAVVERDLAHRELEIAEREMELARAEYEQVKSLHEQQIASKHEFLQKRIARDQAGSIVKLKSAFLERCTVKAPFDGTVVERWAVPGQRVLEDDAEPLFRVVAFDPLRARVDVPEKRFQNLRVGDPAWVRWTGGDVAPLPAKVVFVGPAIDAASGTFPVLVELKDSDPALRVGAAVSVGFGGDAPREGALLRLPREVIGSGTDLEPGEVTLLVVDGERASARKVEVVRHQGASIVIRGPIATTDRVILSAGLKIAEGDRVIPGGASR